MQHSDIGSACFESEIFSDLFILRNNSSSWNIRLINHLIIVNLRLLTLLSSVTCVFILTHLDLLYCKSHAYLKVAIVQSSFDLIICQYREKSLFFFKYVFVKSIVLYIRFRCTRKQNIVCFSLAREQFSRAVT